MSNTISTQSTAADVPTPNIDVPAWQYNFSLFDPNSTGFISTDEIGILIRTMNYNITETQINNYINLYIQSDQCDFHTLLHIVYQHIHEWSIPITIQQLIDSFNSYDTYHTGQIHGSMLVDILRNSGECMSQDDVDGLLCEINIDGDNMINIVQFIQYMVQSSYYPVPQNELDSIAETTI